MCVCISLPNPFMAKVAWGALTRDTRLSLVSSVGGGICSEVTRRETRPRRRQQEFLLLAVSVMSSCPSALLTSLSVMSGHLLFSFLIFPGDGGTLQEICSTS